MAHGLGVSYYTAIEKQRFQTIDDAVFIIKKGYYIAKVDLHHAYRSITVYHSNYKVLGLKSNFYGDSHHTS